LSVAGSREEVNLIRALAADSYIAASGEARRGASPGIGTRDRIPSRCIPLNWERWIWRPPECLHSPCEALVLRRNPVVVIGHRRLRGVGSERHRYDCA